MSNVFPVPWIVTHWAPLSMEFSRPEYWSGQPFPSSGDQGLNPGLPHCRGILYQLRYKGSQRILKWVAYPFSRGSSQLRNWMRVYCITGGFFTDWAIRETPILAYFILIEENSKSVCLPSHPYHLVDPIWSLFKSLFWPCKVTSTVSL